MKKIIHILNGDALRENFPSSITGNQIVMRECLVDGPVTHSLTKDSLEAFYKLRNQFLCANYQIENPIYHNTSVSEIEKIRQIDESTDVYLWFEADLFCQVNLWFICYLLVEKIGLKISLVHPELAYSNNNIPDAIPDTLLQYGFGGLSTPLLESAFVNAQPITPESLSLFAQLWEVYVNKNESELISLSNKLEPHFKFIPDTVSACIDLWNGQPLRLLQQIKTTLGTDDFGEIFQEFNRQGAIYGFGDSQVKRIWADLEKD